MRTLLTLISRADDLSLSRLGELLRFFVSFGPRRLESFIIKNLVLGMPAYPNPSEMEHWVTISVDYVSFVSWTQLSAGKRREDKVGERGDTSDTFLLSSKCRSRRRGGQCGNGNLCA